MQVEDLPPVADIPVEGKTVKRLAQLLVKRSFDLFSYDQQERIPKDDSRVKLSCKMRQEFQQVKNYTASQQGSAAVTARKINLQTMAMGLPEPTNAHNATDADAENGARQLGATAGLDGQATNGNSKDYGDGAPPSSTALVLPPQEGILGNIRLHAQHKWPKPQWHPPWRCYRVISGHLGWVRSLAFDPSNEWFCTGSSDRTIKFWETASGQLKITLTGHIEQVTGLAVSSRHPYLFSCALDKKVLCWDLEQNRNIRHYHGHLSGVYCLALHPQLDVLASGGRDSVCRVWDMRTKLQVYCLSGHQATVASVMVQSDKPQIITGSHDNQIKLWDLRTGKAIETLTYHKKSVRGLAMHPTQAAFVGASPDNLKKYRLPEGAFLHNFLPHRSLKSKRMVVNCVAVNQDDVVASGNDNGVLCWWDWRSGNCFQTELTKVQPGSLDSEAGIFAMGFDVTGSRLVTCEADKTVKMWKEDDRATQASFPIDFEPPKESHRY